MQPKEGFHYAKQRQSEDLLYLRSQHRRKGPDHKGTARLLSIRKPMEEVIADRMLLEQLFARLRELDPEADTIIQLWKNHPEGISDRAITRELGRPQKAFADQMKKHRTDLRRITGDK